MSTKSPSRDELSVRPTSAAAASFISISKASSRVSCEVPGSSVTDIPNIMNLVVRMTSTNSKTIDMSSGSSQSSSDDDNDFNDVSSRLSESPDDYGGSGVEEVSSGPLKKRRKRSTGDDFARSSSTFTAITSSAATNDNESTVAIKSEQIATSAPSKQTKRSRHPMKIHRELRPAPYYFYIDRSGEVDEDALAPLSPPLCTPNFVIKLHAILIREDVKKIIAWMPHGRAWKVIDQDVFQERILPQYFMQSNIASFHRQANGWGFRRILKGPDKGAFYNEYFLRAVPHLCKKMKRVGGAKTIEDANSSHEPNLWMITKEHPLPETLPTNDLNYVALKTINECITEGGPKAKMPFIHDIQKTVSDNANNNRSSEEVYSASSIAASARAFTNTAAANKAASSSSESGHFENNGQSSSAQNEVNSIPQCSEGAVPVNTLESLSKMILQQSDLASRNGQERALTANGQVHFGNNGQASSTRNEVNSIPQCSEGAVPVNTLESLAKMILQQSDLASRNGQQERDLIANGQGGQSDLHSFATSQLTRTGQGIMNLGGYQQLQGCQQQQNQEYQASSTVQDLLDLIGRTSNAFSTAPQDDRLQTLAFPSIRTGQQSQDLASSSQRASNIQDMAGMTSRAAMNRDQTGFIEDYLRSMLGQRPTDVSNVHDSTAKARQTTLPANQQEIIECIIKSMLDQRMHLHQNQNQGTNVVQNGNSQAQHQATSRVSIPPAVASLHANQHEQDYQVGNNTGSMLLDRFQSLQQQYLGNAQVQGSSSLPGQSQSVFPLRSAMGSSISNDVPANLRDLVAEAIVTGIRIGSDYDNGSVSRHPQGQQQNNQRQQHQPRGNSNFGFSNNGRF